MWKTYHMPPTLEQACSLLGEYGEEARIIAGGTDLVLALQDRKVPLAAVIDITRIPDLRMIEVRGDRIVIGAGVTFSHVLQSELLAHDAPHLLQAARTIAGRQIRNVATVVGNIVNASPAADSAPVLSTLQAMIHISDSAGQARTTPLQAFLQDVRKVDLAPGEMVTAISFRRPGDHWRMAFRKVGLRRSMAIAVVNAAVMLKVEGGQIREARIALGSVAPTVVRAEEAEAELKGLTEAGALASDAPRLARKAATPIDDFRASAAYRLAVVAALVRSQLRTLLNGHGEEAQ